MRGDFWRLWVGSSLSSVGDGLRYAALPLLAARLTHDPRMVALVTAAEGAAWLLFGLPSGALADRWDRRVTMVACDVARACLAMTLAAAVATGHASIGLLMVTGFGLNAAETLFYGAAQATIPVVVQLNDLERANGRLYASSVLGEGFIGPPIGGLLFVVAAAAPFAVDAISFGLAALLAFQLRTDLSAGPRDDSPRSLRGEVMIGLRWLWRRQEILRTILILLTVWNLVESAALAVLVLWCLEVLHLPEAGYGLMIAALAAGGVVGSLIAERVGRRLGTGQAMIACVILTVVAYAGLGATNSPIAAGGLMAGVGVIAFVWNVLSASLRQSLTPAALAGRISSAYRFATWGVAAPGAALGGVAASAWGLHAPFLLAAAVLAGAGVATLPKLTNHRIGEARSAGD